MPRLAVVGLFSPLAIALVGLSWVTLLIWEASPYGRYLHHGDWTAIGLAGGICMTLPAGGIILPGALYVMGWVVMTAAMMLPTTLPLIRQFDRMVSSRSDRTALHALLIVGYLLTWGAFGIAAHILDLGLHNLLTGSSWILTHAWVPGATVLAIAGAFQFTRLKYHCLDACRSPFMFIATHWKGFRPRSDAIRLGISHGLYCVGCCWALMLLMFIVGTGSVGWMLSLGLVMAIEKNHSWGRHLAMPLGVLLFVLSGLVVAQNVGLARAFL